MAIKRRLSLIWGIYKCVKSITTHTFSPMQRQASTRRSCRFSTLLLIRTHYFASLGLPSPAPADAGRPATSLALSLSCVSPSASPFSPSGAVGVSFSFCNTLAAAPLSSRCFYSSSCCFSRNRLSVSALWDLSRASSSRFCASSGWITLSFLCAVLCRSCLPFCRVLTYISSPTRTA